MKRTYVPGLTDAIVLNNPEEIRTVSTDDRFDRDFEGPLPVLSWRRIRRMIRVFSAGGRRFPTMQPRTNASRAAAQEELWQRLNLEAERVKLGPAELELLADWVRGIGSEEAIGALVQERVGRLFVSSFTATDESWSAARMVLEAAGSSNFLKMFWWRASGKLERAKTLLASMVNGDLAGTNGISVALHHVVDGLQKMRGIVASPTRRSSMTAQEVVDDCLFAPNNVVRQAKTSGEVGGCPFRRGTLFILELASASKGDANRDLVFLNRSWSRCPAEQWVPALLEGVWVRALATRREPGSN